MEKIYMICFADPIKRDDLKSYIEALPEIKAWFYSIPQSMFVVASIDANTLYKKVVSRFPEHGNVFVSEVPRRNCQGWMPAAHWSIMDEHSVVHSYNLKFDGYWRGGKEGSLPAISGLYCVYASTYRYDNDTVNLDSLLYIGKSINIHERHIEHEAKSFWRSFCSSTQELCYSVAQLDRECLDVAEAAMIFKHKPICNDQLKDCFNHGKTKIITSGCNAKLYTNFIVG